MRKFALPIASGALFALAFYPFGLWPCALVALAPLYFFATDERLTLKEIFWGGCIAGIMVSVPLYYFTLAQLVAGLGLETFTLVIRFLSVPAALFEAALFGLMALVWRILRTHSALLNILAAASAYLVVERFLALLFQGYNPDELAYAAISAPGALTIAALGGIVLVSFAVACGSILLAQFARMWVAKKPARAFVPPLIAALLFSAAVYGYGLQLASSAPGALPVSIIQIAPVTYQNLLFGAQKNGVFSDPALQPFITMAAQGSSLVIYPFSPIDGTATPSQQSALGAWLASFVPTSTATLLWVTAQTQGQLFDEYALWQSGTESTYQKHDLYAFSDYTPAWAQPLGVEKSPFTISPGTSSEPLMLGGVSFEGLICSELHQDSYARAQAARAQVLIAAGYDAFFPGALMGDYSLAVARYRAAENNVPVIRANFYGPSAIINAGGIVQAELPFGARGIVRGYISTSAPRPTLYARFGSWPLYTFIALCLMCAAYATLRKRSS